MNNKDKREKCKCAHCKKTFPRNRVIVNARRGDKISFYCRKCNTDRQRKYRNTENGKKRVYEAIYKSNKKYRDRVNARQNLNYHLSKGHLKKSPKCEMCKKRKKLEGHHMDYSKPLEVMWLCRPCHSDL